MAKQTQAEQCAAFLNRCGFDIEQDFEFLEIKTRGDLAAVHRMISALVRGEYPKEHKNAFFVEYFVNNSDHGKKCGASFNEFAAWLERGTIPLAAFTAARDRIESQIADKIGFAINDSKMKKRRALSDCDGEYNRDRHGHDLPYETVSKQSVPDKTLAIEAHYAVEKAVGSRDIAKYAATIWAIAGIAESHGVLCDIVRTNKATASSSCKVWSASESIKIKKTGEYLSPALMAVALHPAMYRIAMWTARSFAMSAFGYKMRSAIGSPWQPSHCLLSTPGRLELSSRVVSELPEHLERVIVEKICGQVAS